MSPHLCFKLWFCDEADRETCTLSHKSIVLLFCCMVLHTQTKHIKNLLMLKIRTKTSKQNKQFDEKYKRRNKGVIATLHTQIPPTPPSCIEIIQKLHLRLCLAQA